MQQVLFGQEIIKKLEDAGRYVWAFDKNEISKEYNRTLKVKINDNNDFEKNLSELCEKYETYPEILIDTTGNNSIKKHSFNLSVDEFKQQLNDNLASVYSHVSAYAKLCSRVNYSGKIILLGSIGAQMSHREMVGYDSAKGGLEAMTRGLALDYAPYNININLIAVGPIESSPSSTKDEEKTENLRKLLPIGRYPDLAEVAKFIVDFSTNLPIFITGQKITVDGGLTSQLRPVYVEKLNEPNMYKLGEDK